MRRLNTTSAVAILLLVGTGCGSSDTTSPYVPSNPVVSAPTKPYSPNFPEPSGPARIFVYDHALWDHPQSYTMLSRFVLYDNHAFALQFGSPSGAYLGGYTETAGVIIFDWEGWSSAGPWGATGILKGDTLTVQYNLVMQLTDFEDAAYILAR